MNERLVLFTTGFVQVALVGVNTWQIAHEKWFGCAVVGFLISYVWSWNVKKIAFGGHTDRVIYALGAAFGVLAGLGVASLLYGGLE
jgi:hypothetical protein